MTVEAFPDAEAVVVAWLADHAAVAAIVGDRIATELDADPTFPCLRVTRTGGLPAVPRRLDSASIYVEAFGAPDEGSAGSSLLARTTRAALRDVEGQTVDGAVVTAVDDETGLLNLPDDTRDPTIPRHAFTVSVCLHS